MRVRVRDCVYWGWGPFWALWAQVLIWWPIVGLVVRVAPSHPMMGPHLLFYVVLFSLPFVGIAVNFCLFRFLHPRRALGWMVPVAFGFMSFPDAFSWYVDARFWFCGVWFVSGYFVE